MPLLARGSRSVSSERAPVRFGELLGDRETEPEASLPALGARPLVEHVEDTREQLRAHADAGVPNPERDGVSITLQSDIDAPTARREFERVVQQVRDDLVQARRIPVDVHVVRHAEGDADTLLLQLRFEG